MEPTAQKPRLPPVQDIHATAMAPAIRETTVKWSSITVLGLRVDLDSAYPNQEDSSASVDLTMLGPPAPKREMQEPRNRGT